MPLLARVLEVPSYGWERRGGLYVPSTRELLAEFFSRTCFWRNRKYWLAAFSWSATLVQILPLTLFIAEYFSVSLCLFGFVYSMGIMGAHGTVYYHRYSTHRAFQFKNQFWRFLIKHMVIKMVPEEQYVVSHHVHHWIAEQPGDPYNVHGGWLYCFLADAIHQPIATNLSREDYARVTGMLSHTGIYMNSYEQYQKWGSVSHPVATFFTFCLNWAFWYSIFYTLGGHPLACTLFGWAGAWGIGIRTFNYDGHGRGKDRRKKGIDFHRADLSINQLWPGLITGEWHNNHHLYPHGARAGFLGYQFDSAWWIIRGLAALGGISSYRDCLNDFLEKYYRPHCRKVAEVLPSSQPVKRRARRISRKFFRVNGSPRLAPP